ncbi:MATE family efflux transporter [Methylocella tundrae]|uniref:MATE family efflux transporter n=2 Tax=Methylocella tundrae TaxID=227605 RepID=A0A8B6M3N4_METTU|nr:MATE family efflux transporter [Methylocella tundrae]VTZ49416.1 MATE family efflux transporter [Methylocella tundrae]
MHMTLSSETSKPSAIFTEGSTMRHVLAMTGAASIGLMSIFVVDLLSLLYVSRLGDPDLTAAVGFATQLLFFSVSINIGLAIAIGALVSRAIGAGQRPAARRLAASGLVHVFVISALVSCAALPFRRDILELLGASGEALDVASTYLLFTLPATVGLGLGMALAGLLRAVGDARQAMYVTLSGAVATAILDPIFIFGLGLGVEGAAIVTIFSRIIFVVVGLTGAVYKHDLIALPRGGAAISDAPALMRIAIPAILTNVAAPAANAYSMRIFAHFGEPVVAAFAIMDRITPVAFGVLFALSGSVGPIMGQNLGARLYDRIRQILTNSFAFAAVYVVAVALILSQASPLIIGVFAARGQTAELLNFFCLTCGGLWFFLGGIFVANASFNNLGFPVLSTLFNWGRATVGTIPFVTIGAARFGPEGGFIGLIAGATLFGVFAVVMAYFVTARLARDSKDG